MQRREGDYRKVAAMLYRAVTQAVILFGLKTWVLLTEMERTVEGTHTGFLRQIMGNQARRKADGTWVTPGTEVVRERWEPSRK